MAILLSTLFSLWLAPLGAMNTAYPSDGNMTAANSTCKSSPPWSQQVFRLMNTTVDPCDDFYEFVCGNFKKYNNKFSPGESKISQFTKNDLALSQKLKTVLEKTDTKTVPFESVRAKVRRYYESCKDEKAADENGLKAMRWMVEQLGGFWFDKHDVEQQFDLTRELVKLSSFTPNGFFYWGVASNPLNSSTHSLQIFQGSLSMGSDTRDYYINKTKEEKDPILLSYHKLLRTYVDIIFEKNNTYLDKFVDMFVSFEQRLAEIQMAKHQLRNHSLSFSTTTVGKMNTNFSFLNWTRFFIGSFETLGIHIGDDEPVVVHCTPYINRLARLLGEMLENEEGRRILHNYLVFRAVDDYSKYFGQKFRRAYNDFAQVFEGRQGQEENWHHCVTDTDATIGFPLSAMYLDEYFSPENKKKVVNLTMDVVAAFRKRLENATWMLNETRSFALKKLDALVYDIGYPDWIINSTYLDKRYENLTVTNNYAKNQFHAFKYTFQRELMKLRQVEHDVSQEWYMTPTTANAYYASHQNKFVMPVGLLDTPFYYKDFDVPISVNFGAIGAIVSHELSHAIDDNGRQYDEHGHWREWWDNETLSRFDERANCIVDQYNSYRTEDGLQLRGAQTVGENIADSGAVRISFDAYRKVGTSSSSQVVFCSSDDTQSLNLTSDQLFFVAFGQMWCSVFTSEARRLNVIQDEHPPSNFRVIGTLSHFSEFSKAFNCSENSIMNSKTKCSIW